MRSDNNRDTLWRWRAGKYNGKVSKIRVIRVIKDQDGEIVITARILITDQPLILINDQKINVVKRSKIRMVRDQRSMC